MAFGLQAASVLGVAFEVTYGTYVAPTKYMPFRSEDLKYMQESTYRRPIRGIVDAVSLVAGPAHTEGTIEIEGLHDAMVYFLYASRNSIVKSGAGAPFTYTCTPTHGAAQHGAIGVAGDGRSLSITIVRNGIVFGYTGCVVTSLEFTTDNQMYIARIGVMGLDETVQSLPTATFSTVSPFVAGQYTITIGGVVVTDIDQFTFTVNDNPEPQKRLRSSRAITFIKMGERAISASIEQDFQTRTDYDAYKAYTAQIWIVLVTDGTNSFQIKMAAAVKSTYEVADSGPGNLVRAAVTYEPTYDATSSKAYEMILLTSESIT